MEHLVGGSACASSKDCGAETDPGSWCRAVAATNSELSEPAGDMAMWDPYQNQQEARSGSDLQPGAKNKPKKLDLLTVKAMPNQALAKILEARACTYQQLRQRGLDLWRTQTTTMEAADRQAAKSHLEWRLSNKDIANYVGTFRQVLQVMRKNCFHDFFSCLRLWIGKSMVTNFALKRRYEKWPRRNLFWTASASVTNSNIMTKTWERWTQDKTFPVKEAKATALARFRAIGVAYWIGWRIADQGHGAGR